MRGRKPPNYGKTYETQILTAGQVEKVLSGWKGGIAGARNRAMTIVMWRCNLRIAEVCALHPDDVWLEERSLHVLLGKGAVRRVVGIDDLTYSVLVQWLDVRARLDWIEPATTLFPVVAGPTKGRRMRPQLLNSALKRAAENARLHRRVNPHAFRHTWMFDQSMNGMPVPLAQKALGHKHLSTTQRYADHIAAFAVVQEMAAQKTPRGFASGVEIAYGGTYGSATNPYKRPRK